MKETIRGGARGAAAGAAIGATVGGLKHGFQEGDQQMQSAAASPPGGCPRIVVVARGSYFEIDFLNI